MDARAVGVEAAGPPFPPELRAVFDRVMPPGVPPLELFTTLAGGRRIDERLRAGSLIAFPPP